eukprot:scaffold320_cov335-Pavlova_lutheri.AAC.17
MAPLASGKYGLFTLSTCTSYTWLMPTMDTFMSSAATSACTSFHPAASDAASASLPAAIIETDATDSAVPTMVCGLVNASQARHLLSTTPSGALSAADAFLLAFLERTVLPRPVHVLLVPSLTACDAPFVLQRAIFVAMAMRQSAFSFVKLVPPPFPPRGSSFRTRFERKTIEGRPPVRKGMGSDRQRRRGCLSWSRTTTLGPKKPSPTLAPGVGFHMDRDDGVPRAQP